MTGQQEQVDNSRAIVLGRETVGSSNETGGVGTTSFAGGVKVEALISQEMTLIHRNRRNISIVLLDSTPDL